MSEKTMNNKETISFFKFNQRVAHMNADDLTQAESLAVPAGGANCLNWVVGHIVASRDDIFEALGMPRLVSEEFYKLYERGSGNITPENAVDIKELLRMLDESQQPLVDKLSAEDQSANALDFGSITFLAFHEAYHIGQTGVLRRAAGKEGVIK